jgi:hypothetical protein
LLLLLFWSLLLTLLSAAKLSPPHLTGDTFEILLPRPRFSVSGKDQQRVRSTDGAVSMYGMNIWLVKSGLGLTYIKAQVRFFGPATRSAVGAVGSKWRNAK